MNWSADMAAAPDDGQPTLSRFDLDEIRMALLMRAYRLRDIGVPGPCAEGFEAHATRCDGLADKVCRIMAEITPPEMEG